LSELFLEFISLGFHLEVHEPHQLLQVFVLVLGARILDVTIHGLFKGERFITIFTKDSVLWS
jgi:hypothetical protein